MSSQYLSVDREAVWAALFSWLKARLWAAPWAPDTVYAAGAVVCDPQGYLQTVTTPGTSGTTQPTWNDAGGQTADGTVTPVTWTNTGVGFVSMGRKHKAPPALGLLEQPALFVVQMSEEHVPQKPPGAPTKLTLHGFLILYLQAPVPAEEIGQETQLAAAILNARFKAIDAALEPDDARGKFTVGGLVEHCWIEGETRQDPGILGPQAAAIVPLHILVP